MKTLILLLIPFLLISCEINSDFRIIEKASPTGNTKYLIAYEHKPFLEKELALYSSKEKAEGLLDSLRKGEKLKEEIFDFYYPGSANRKRIEDDFGQNKLDFVNWYQRRIGLKEY